MAQILTLPVANQAPTHPAYFPVSIQPIAATCEGGNAADATGYQAVIREDTGKVLGVHGADYKLVPHRSVFEPMGDLLLEALTKEGMDTEVKVKDTLAYDGALAVQSYTFPGITVAPRVGDYVQLQVKLTNSYNALNAFQAFVGGFRLWCTNGCTSLHGSAVSGRHTSGFDQARMVEKLRKALEQFLVETGQWQIWAEREVTDEQVNAVFGEVPQANPRLIGRLQEAYEIESAGAGSTLWAVYNALTRWSTHGQVQARSEGNVAAIQLRRESAVRKAIKSSAFRALSA